MGSEQEFGPNYSPGPACVAAADCAEAINRSLESAKTYLDGHAALAEQLNSIDKSKHAGFGLTSDIDYHLRVNRNNVSTSSCSGVIDSLAGWYYNGDDRPGAVPPFQRLVNVAEQLLAEMATQFTADMTAAAAVRDTVAQYPGRAQLDDAEAAYRQAVEDGEPSAVTSARSAFLGALSSAQTYANEAKTQSTAVEQLRQDSAELVAALGDTDLAPFVAAGAADEAQQLAARADALAAGTGQPRGDATPQLALLQSDLEGVRLQLEDAQRARSQAQQAHDALFGELTRARALLSAAGEPRLQAALDPKDVDDLRAAAKAVRGFLDLPLPDLAGRQKDVEQARSTIARLDAAVSAAKSAVEQPAPSDTPITSRPESPSASAPPIEDPKRAEAVENGRAAPTDFPNQGNGPYTDFQMMGFEMMALLSNPLNMAEFETRLRQKGVAGMSVIASDILPDGGNWVVRFSGDGTAPDPEQGFFCRVQASDARSIGELRKLQVGRPRMLISGGVGEYTIQSEPPPGFMRIVFDPCTIDEVPER